MLEGAKLVEAALEAAVPLEAVFHAPGAEEAPGVGALIGRARDAGARVFTLRPGLLEAVSDTVTPQPVCAVAPFVDVPLGDLLAPAALAEGPVVVCVTVRDPGNLGAIVRSADAAGCAGVVVCGESADPYNPKVVRASAGALVRVRLAVGGDPAGVIDALRAAGVRSLATVARHGDDYLSASLEPPVALVLGNEANGLDPSLQAQLDGVVTIPMAGGGESLNVAMAATVLCFEAARRRRAGQASAGEHLR